MARFRRVFVDWPLLPSLFLVSAGSAAASAQDPVDDSPPTNDPVVHFNVGTAVLDEALDALPADSRWRFVQQRADEIFKIDEERQGALWSPLALTNSDNWAVREWHREQLPEGRAIAGSTLVKVLYLPGCDSDRLQNIETILPGEAATWSDFSVEQWERAKILHALSAEGVPDPAAALDDVDLAASRGAEALLNGALAARRSSEMPLLVLRSYCVPENGLPAPRPNMIENIFSEVASIFVGAARVPPPPRSPPPPTPPAPAYAPPRYYFVDLPDGMTTAKIGRGVEARQCRQRRRVLQECLPVAADELKAIPFVRSGRHVFVGRVGDEWVSESFTVSDNMTYEYPPPLLAGRTYADSGYAIRLVYVPPR